MAIDPSIITTVRVGELPTASFSLTDKIPREVGVDLKQGTIQDLITFIQPFIGAIQYQVITLHVNAAYITANFDSTGLGTNLMLGYAICNGNNGTVNKDGRTGIAYGTTNNVIGQLQGAKTVALTKNNIPQLDLTVPCSDGEESGGTRVYVMANDIIDNIGNHTYVNSVNAATTNVPVNVMQPSIVELQVMKL